MKVINIDFLISGTKITIPFKAICSVTNKEFEGNAIIEYHPADKVVEFVDVERYIKDITKKKLVVEELADKIFREVKTSIAPEYLKIVIDVEKSDAHQPVQVWIEKT